MNAEQTILSLKNLTDQMLVAAREHDYEKLSVLSDQYFPIVADLLLESPALPPSLQSSLETILDNQSAISALTTPWLESVRKLLRDHRQEQALAATYRDAP